jgi:hypothetical protein
MCECRQCSGLSVQFSEFPANIKNQISGIVLNFLKLDLQYVEKKNAEAVF